MEAMVALVEDERKLNAMSNHAFSKVSLIRLTLGALGPADPEALRFCFDAVARGTIADGARLEIETVPGEGWCPSCRRAAPLPERFAACPACGDAPMQMTGGYELRLVELEVA
jgi:hydrogenase nickel incorporation protein HypA/HybF